MGSRVLPAAFCIYILNAINTTTNDVDTNNTNATTIPEPHPERYPVGCPSPDTKLLPGHPGRVHTINTTTNNADINNTTNATTVLSLIHI